MQYVSSLKYPLFTDPRKLYKYNNYTFLERTKAGARFAS